MHITDEKDLALGLAEQTVTAPIHIAGAASNIMPNNNDPSIMTPLTRTQKAVIDASMREAEKLAHATWNYIAALPVRAAMSGAQMIAQTVTPNITGPDRHRE